MMHQIISKKSQLKEIAPYKIIRNPDNPRLFFRPEEMDALLGSIKRHGIQVPITVYKEEENYVLIDGERRWRCAHKLNLKNIPALVQVKPSPLNNLLLMFNIHALREQWDYLTIANKLPDVKKRFATEHDGIEPNEIEISEITGLTRGQIRRCNLLLEMPPKYLEMLILELGLPKQKQELSEDFFIEMERALKTVNKRVPSALKEIDNVRDSLINKYRKKIIRNVTDFRKLSKIVTAIDKSMIDENIALKAVNKIFNPANEISIDDVFSEHFELLYDERKIILNIKSIADYLESFTKSGDRYVADKDVLMSLSRLKRLIEKVLEG